MEFHGDNLRVGVMTGGARGLGPGLRGDGLPVYPKRANVVPSWTIRSGNNIF
jgi:hypothetical protein